MFQVPKEYLAIQYDYAYKFVDLFDFNLIDCVVNNTAFYRLFHLNKPYSAKNAVWSRYLDGFQKASNKLDYTYDYYLDIHSYYVHYLKKDVYLNRPQYSFFYYTANTEKEVKLHTNDYEVTKHGPLDSKNIDARKSELRELFEDIKQTRPEVEFVLGSSWLYNTEPYNRLFPKEYIDSCYYEHLNTSSNSLWGQFLNSEHRVKYDMLKKFRSKIDSAKNITDLLSCFEYKVKNLRSKIDMFYKFFDISN